MTSYSDLAVFFNQNKAPSPASGGGKDHVQNNFYTFASSGYADLDELTEKKCAHTLSYVNIFSSEVRSKMHAQWDAKFQHSLVALP